VNTVDDNGRAQSGNPVSDPEEGAAAATIPGLVCLADVEPLEVQWLWRDRLPSGMIAVLDGPPGIGKSTVVADIAAHISTGRPLPGETGPRDPTDVLLVGCEDSAAHTVRPRLDAAGADVRRVHLLEEIDGKMIKLPDDVGRLEEIVREKGARLVVIDPLSAYIGQVDLHRDNEVRAALAPLAGLAQRTSATVLLVRHLRKSGGTDAIGRGLGSIAISAVARTVMMLLGDPDDPANMVLAWPKLSVGPAPSSLRWSRTVVEGRPKIVWGTECPLSADDILARHDERYRGAGKAGETTVVDSTAEWLMSVLEGPGFLPVEEIKQRAAKEGIAWRTVERAKARLGIRARRVGTPGEGGGGHWVWAAPDLRHRTEGDPEMTTSSERPAKAAKQESLAALTSNGRRPRQKGAKLRADRLEAKTATPKTAKNGVAALTGTDGATPDGPQGEVSSPEASP